MTLPMRLLTPVMGPEHWQPSITTSPWKEKNVMAVCVTGHRSGPKLGGYDNKTVERRIYVTLYNIVQGLYNSGQHHFISGGAIGVDQIFAEAVTMLKAVGKTDALLTIAKPFPSQASRWPANIQEKFRLLCAAADEVVNVSEDPYASWKMQKRNVWMVDKSEIVIAVWDGVKSGGTWNCLKYALDKKRIVIHINPSDPMNTWKILEPGGI